MIKDSLIVALITLSLGIAARVVLVRTGASERIESLARATPSPSPAAARYLQLSCSSSDPCQSGKDCIWELCSDGNIYFHRGSDDTVQPLACQ